jgi:hypothetical protein
MTQTATNSSTDLRPAARTSRVRLWIALAAAAMVFGVGLLGVLPFILDLPVIGVVLAFGSPRTTSLMPDPLAGGRVTPSSESRSWPHWP